MNTLFLGFIGYLACCTGIYGFIKFNHDNHTNERWIADLTILIAAVISLPVYMVSMIWGDLAAGHSDTRVALEAGLWGFIVFVAMLCWHRFKYDHPKLFASSGESVSRDLELANWAFTYTFVWEFLAG